MNTKGKWISKIVGRNFSSEWKPRIPKHKIIIDKTYYRAPHAIWDKNEVEKIEMSHFIPITLKDKAAYYMILALRRSFDYFSSYKPGNMDEDLYFRRCIFLETIAGVPGMVAAMIRHMKSVGSLNEDKGWIHYLLEEAENERMHLLTFLKIRQPGLIQRLFIVFGQAGFLVFFFAMYTISSRSAHRFVGYLEEEAVKTYTNIIKELDEGKLTIWQNTPAPDSAIKYWGLSQNATIREVIVSIRADEAMHREYNHHFADIPQNSPMEREKIYISDDIINEDYK